MESHEEAVAGQEHLQDGRDGAAPGDEGNVRSNPGDTPSQRSAQGTPPTMIEAKPEWEEAALGAVGAPADAQAQGIEEHQRRHTSSIKIRRA